MSGDHGLDHNTTALLKKMDDDHNGTVDLGEFRRMEHNANTLLQPCYIIQERMISELGATFWGTCKLKSITNAYKEHTAHRTQYIITSHTSSSDADAVNQQ